MCKNVCNDYSIVFMSETRYYYMFLNNYMKNNLLLTFNEEKFGYHACN